MSAKMRSLVTSIVEINSDEALRLARTISDGWFRCQSLSEVAFVKKNSKPEFLKIIKEALKAAKETKQPNRIVSASCWAIWVMSKREDVTNAEILPIIEQMLQIIGEETNPVRQSDALLYLFEATYSRSDFRKIVLNPLLDACLVMRSWKKPRTLGDIVLVLAADDLNLAKAVLEIIEKKSKRTSIMAEIKLNCLLGAHDFLPYYAKPHPKVKL